MLAPCAPRQVTVTSTLDNSANDESFGVASLCVPALIILSCYPPAQPRRMKALQHVGDANVAGVPGIKPMMAQAAGISTCASNLAQPPRKHHST